METEKRRKDENAIFDTCWGKLDGISFVVDSCEVGGGWQEMGVEKK